MAAAPEYRGGALPFGPRGAIVTRESAFVKRCVRIAVGSGLPIAAFCPIINLEDGRRVGDTAQRAAQRRAIEHGRVALDTFSRPRGGFRELPERVQ